MTEPAIESDLIAVAMSGGLDSSVAAWLLARQGRPVVGLSMLLWDQSERRGARPLLRRPRPRRRQAGGAAGGHPPLHPAPGPGVPRQGRRSLRRRLPRRPHAQPLRALQHLDQVRPPARAGAAAGRGRVATGHYARILDGPGRPRAAHRASTPEKDQSYYLFELTREQLAASLFPLGELTKPRGARARPRGRPGGGREGGEHGGLLRRRRRARVRRGAGAGRFPSATRRRLRSRPCWSIAAGRGAGRRASPTTATPSASAGGSGSPPGAPSTCCAIEPEENRVVVGEEAELLAPGLLGERLHWIGPDPAPRARSRRR